MRVLITGIEGFAGSHLAEHCLAEGDEVWGTIFSKGRSSNIAGFFDRLNLRIGDITDPEFLVGLLREVRIDVVYNLAAITFVPLGEQLPSTIFGVNLLGGIQLLEAVRTQSPETRVVIISSAEVYGHIRPDQSPVKETVPVAPANIVGSTKAALEVAVQPFVRTYGVDVLIARPFNHTGPRQRTDFVCSTFAEQIAKIEIGEEPVVKVGNLTPRRDFSDVRDIVRGYRCLAESGKSGEAYNLAAGKSVSIETILETLTQMARVRVEVKEDPERTRQTQVMDVCGDIQKIHEACQWEPNIPLEKSLRDLLNYHRDMIRNETIGSGRRRT